MTPRPVIFISAVSKELRDQRELVAKTLRFLGCEPVLQDEFGTETGNIRDMLAKKITPCDGLIQLVGKAQGGVVKEAQRVHDVMSYTQYEAFYAEQEKKRVWYILLAEAWSLPLLDAEGKDLPPESQDDVDDQRAYARKVKRSPHLYHIVSDDRDLEIATLKMLHELDTLRTQRTHWLQEGNPTSLPGANASTPELLTKGEARQMLDEYFEKLGLIRQESDPRKEEASEDALIAQLAEVRGQSADEVRRQLNQTAVAIQQDPAEPAMKRAEAAFARREFKDAEALALQAAQETAKRGPADNADQCGALLLAGNSAREGIDYPKAMEHYLAAAALTDVKRDLSEWLRVQNAIGWLYQLQGRYPQWLTHSQEVWQQANTHGQPHDPDVLRSRHHYASALDFNGKSAEAEVEYRAVLKVQERVLEPEHPNTLTTRMNLGLALHSQGKYVEAEVEYRAVLKGQERVLGPDHPNILASRGNLGNALDSQGKYAQAEVEYRAVLKVRERVQGPEHPDVFLTCYNLADTLEKLNQLEEAHALMQRSEIGRRKALGLEHPFYQQTKAALERIQAKLEAKKAEK